MSERGHNELSGRVALVSGGASGIGRETVEELARAGAKVGMAYHPDHDHDGEAEAAGLRDDGLAVTAIAADVSDPDSVEGMYGRLQAEFGPADIVVANASIATRSSSEEADFVVWDQVIATNLTGAYRTLAPAIPGMAERGFGRLLVTASVSGPLVAWPDHAAYCASKAGLVGLMRVLAVDLAGAGITANAIAPGLVRTPQSLDEVNSLGAKRMEEVTGSIPAGRVGVPGDIAAAFRFLAGDAAGYMTGQVLTIDGGASLVEAA